MINAFAKKISLVLFLNNIIVLTVFSEHPVINKRALNETFAFKSYFKVLHQQKLFADYFTNKNFKIKIEIKTFR